MIINFTTWNKIRNEILLLKHDNTRTNKKISGTLGRVKGVSLTFLPN